MFGRRRTSARAPKVLAYAAPRERVVDEHMFAVDDGVGRRGTFRLQLFTAAGARPVAIVTQQFDSGPGEGASLTNAAEHYAAAVWRRYFPDDAEPPIWIQLVLLGGDSPLEGFQAVKFTVTGPHRLERPNWEPLRPQEVAALVGGEVDPGRGEGYIPAPAEPEAEFFYRVAWVAALPRPEPFREPACMPRGTSWPRRLGRQLLPRRSARSCCWYHGGDWHRVSRAAIRLVRAARKAEVPTDDIYLWCKERIRQQNLSEWEIAALDSLLAGPGIGIQPSEGGHSYINGQHRAQAMLDTGVHRTVVIARRYPDPID